MAGMSMSDVVAPSVELVRARVSEAIALKHRMLDGSFAAQAVDIAQRIIGCLRSGGKVIFFGNGGSAQDAGHLAAELMGRFAFDRPGLAAMSLPDATAAMTAIGNAIGRRGDVVIGLSTSGDSLNVVHALEAAGQAGMTTVALTGARGGKVAGLAEICIRIPSDNTGRVQEACLHLGHIICEMVEAAMFPRPS
jgi:D-sedoheptulose 7-phosphate isomerase